MGVTSPLYTDSMVKYISMCRWVRVLPCMCKRAGNVLIRSFQLRHFWPSVKRRILWIWCLQVTQADRRGDARTSGLFFGCSWEPHRAQTVLKDSEKNLEWTSRQAASSWKKPVNVTYPNMLVKATFHVVFTMALHAISTYGLSRPDDITHFGIFKLMVFNFFI